MKVYNSEDFNKELKADNSPITEADLAADKVIHEELLKLFPKIPILSEETVDAEFSIRKNWNEFFMVDPLDGTKEFIKKNGEFTVNIAYMKNNLPLLGVVYAPAKEVLYYNTSQTEAYREVDGKKEKLPIKNAETYTVVASRSHMSDKTKDYISELEKVHGEVDIISMGSSFKLCLLAEGRAHEYPRLAPTSEWDIAAAHAVLNASGGSLVQFNGLKPFEYNKKDILNPYFLARSASAQN